MAAINAGPYTAAMDKAYKTFSTQEVHIDRRELIGLSERGAKQFIDQKFQEQLCRARAAFLQEFRNHSVQTETEIKKIREELTETLDQKYGEKIAQLRQQAAEQSALVQKHMDEIAQLKRLASAQEVYVAAVRHRWGLETRERLRGEINTLKEEADRKQKENEDLSHQLLCRDELVAQLGSELSALENELKQQASTFAEEKRAYEERMRSLRLEMRQRQDQFGQTLHEYEEKFSEYKSKTTAELQIQDILNARRSSALSSMEDERQRHVKARTKPTQRIGPGGQKILEAEAQKEEDASYVPYELSKDSRYRVDDMGMDTSWRDYQLSEMTQAPSTQRKNAMPRFRVERITGQVAGPS